MQAAQNFVDESIDINMATTLCFLAGNNTTLKEGSNVCGKASKFSKLE